DRGVGRRGDAAPGRGRAAVGSPARTGAGRDDRAGNAGPGAGDELPVPLGPLVHPPGRPPGDRDPGQGSGGPGRHLPRRPGRAARDGRRARPGQVRLVLTAVTGQAGGSGREPSSPRTQARTHPRRTPWYAEDGGAPRTTGCEGYRPDARMLTSIASSPNSYSRLR